MAAEPPEGGWIMLYPKNQLPALDDALFRAPTSEYRATPFWAWNGKLKDDTLLMQIEMMKKMGMGGFHMHVRTGMDSPYLDEEFMAHARVCVEKAREEDMLAWLYDEDRWPSGSAGGKVTAEHPEYAMKLLVFTVKPYEDGPKEITKSVPEWGQKSMRRENGRLLAVYDVQLNLDGTLKAYDRVSEDAPAAGTRWYLYAERCTDDPWFNDHPYVDVLMPEAIDSFINITHEAYYKSFGADFGGLVPAIFTDEPRAAKKFPLSFALEQRDVFFQWTDGLPDAYRAAYGEDPLDFFPELVWELPEGRLSRFRYRFQNVVADRFASNYCGRIGKWCREHNLMLTGHLYTETTLRTQTDAMGEAMRCYPHFGLPGIDMLCDFHEFNTAKQAQSMVRQEGKPGMLSELYGVTGWDYDFRGHKLQGDWQAAMGVTVRVPHLTWMTMKGEAKRDYPAAIGYQSPWWDQYSMVEDHFARLNTALTRGKADVRVAVIHPIESYWMYWGPSAQTAARRDQLEKQFEQLTEYLLFGLIDFDFISEACLPAQCAEGGYPLKVGEMSYDAVIVCGCCTLRGTTLERLDAFEKAGGRLLMVGDCPGYIDGMASDAAAGLYGRAIRPGFDRTAILGALEPVRFVDIRTFEGHQADRLVYQLRKDGESRWLFVANGVNPVSPDVEPAYKLRFALAGEFIVTEYDTLSGEIRPLKARYEDGMTILERVWNMHDSWLLRLEPGRREGAERLKTVAAAKPQVMMKPVEISLSEPNMLLLDMAEYAMNDGSWQPLEEILRLDNAARAELGIPLRRKEIVQPYLIQPEKCENYLRLRFTIPSEIRVEKPLLALEEPENTQVRFNGVEVPCDVNGWFVDRDIHTIALPPVEAGENVLEVRVPIGRRTNLEAFYLLGDFGVRVCGVEKTIVPPVRRLGFGDVTVQGLPFYTGNIDYHMEVETGEDLRLRVPHWRGALVKVLVDGEEAGNIAFSPYEIALKGLTSGKHRITLRLYGTRQNGFAQLHHTTGVYFYQSPNSWRSEGDLWRYEYQFRPMGILKSPEMYD